MANNPIYRDRLTNVSTGAATGGTAVNSAAVDMQGWDGVVFVGRLATSNAGNHMNAAQATATGATFNDLESTAITDETHMRLDIYRPQKRYVRAEFDRSGTNTAVGDVWAIQYNGRDLPVSTSDNVGEFHATPTEGTATA